jgi:hypothetical protein
MPRRVDLPAPAARLFPHYRGDLLFACRVGEWKAHFKTQTGYGQPKAEAHESALLSTSIVIRSKSATSPRSTPMCSLASLKL